jgi:NitT/TauT family transport system substrate-binding protein
MMTDYTSGLPTSCIFSYLEQNPSGITFKKSSGITSPKQLAGKTLGVSTGSANIAVLAQYLAKNGLTEGRAPNQVHVQILSLSALALALVTGAIDGEVAFAPSDVAALESEGYPANDLLFTQSHIAQEVYTCYAVSDTWAAGHPRVLKEIDEGLEVSTLDTMAHPGTAGQDLVLTAPATAPNAAVDSLQFRSTEDFMVSPNTKGHPIGWMSPKDFAATEAFGELYLGLPPFNTSLLFTDKYVDEACQALGNTICIVPSRLTKHS